MAPGICTVQRTPVTPVVSLGETIVADLLMATLVDNMGNSQFPFLWPTSAHFFSLEELTYNIVLFMSMICLSITHPEILRV